MQGTLDLTTCESMSAQSFHSAPVGILLFFDNMGFVGEMGPHPEPEHDWSKLKMVTLFSLISDSSRGEPLSSPAKNIAGTSVEDLCYMFSTLKKRREAEQKNLFSSHGHSRVRA